MTIETPEPGITGSIELIPASAIREHPDNPRRGDLELIRDSIARNGWHGVLVVQRSSGYILAGNHRYRAGTTLSEWEPDDPGAPRLANLEKFPVHMVDVDDATALRIVLADNRTSDVATYDDPTLLRLFAQIGDPAEAAKILANPDADAFEVQEALRFLAQTAPAERFSGTGYNRDAVQQIALGLEGGGALDAGAKGNKELDRERWATIDVRQIGLVMNEVEFNKAVAILMWIRTEEGLETNTDAVLWLLDRFDRELDGKPSSGPAPEPDPAQ